MATPEAKENLTAAVQTAQAAGLPWAQILAIVIQILSGFIPKPTAAAKGAAAGCELDPCGEFCCEAAAAIQAVHAEDYDAAGQALCGQAKALLKMQDMDDPDA